MRGSIVLAAAGIHGATAVAFGAYAAHGMSTEYAANAVEWTRTGALYQLVHAVALLALAALADRRSIGPARWAATVAGWAFVLGPALFAGALYGLAFGGSPTLAIAAPVGGGLMILGWIALAAAGAFWGRSAADSGRSITGSPVRRAERENTGR